MQATILKPVLCEVNYIDRLFIMAPLKWWDIQYKPERQHSGLEVEVLLEATEMGKSKEGLFVSWKKTQHLLKSHFKSPYFAFVLTYE